MWLSRESTVAQTSAMLLATSTWQGFGTRKALAICEGAMSKRWMHAAGHHHSCSCRRGSRKLDAAAPAMNTDVAAGANARWCATRRSEKRGCREWSAAY